MAAEVLGAVRREKTAHKRSMRARVALLTVTGPPATLAAVEAARGDIVDAGGVDELVVAVGDALVGGGAAGRRGLTRDAVEVRRLGLAACSCSSDAKVQVRFAS